jgi:hypothetical protein
MKVITSILLILTLVLTLQAQVPVKKDIMQMLEKYPAPPADAKEAFA